MAAIGSSEPPKLAEYDVFLSFRGFDTRKTFTSCLYHDLVRAGVRVFRDDDELSKGKVIGSELLRAIANSRICLPILSPNFAMSAWCLREVTHMVECMRNSGHRLEILPIFYNVDVANVKLRTGSTYEAHINQHKDRFEEKVLLKWKDALKEVAKIKGWSLNDDSDHGQLVKSIVGDIMAKLNIKYRNVPTYLVGLQDEVNKVMTLMDVDSEGVKFIVIHGMGGIGKTTLAKAVFNKLYSNYECCSFLENVRETTKQHGLLHLQKKLLYDILNHDFAMEVRGIDDGINMIRGRLCHKKALIVIDDVDEDSQIKSLARRSGWFASGSRIIITTRDRGVLKMEGEVDKPHYHEVKQMPFNDALCLFSWHAFGTGCPPHDYDDISRDIVRATSSLPLALEVVGSLLSCKCLDSCACMEIWKGTLNELRRMPNKKVQETLMISIDKLDVRQRTVFLDIACFFIDKDKDNAIYMWSACDISTDFVINFLVQMSLIKIGNNNKFWMHDQLRDLGREIIRQENFNNVGRHSRVWIDQDAEKIINNNQGTKHVEALCLNSGNFTLTYDALANLRNLRFLKLQGGQYTIGTRRLLKRHREDFLPNLRWLCWHYPPYYFEMKHFCCSNLVVLELCNSSIREDWKGWARLKTASKLKVLDLTGCEQLRRTPDFSSFFLLERLILQCCPRLVEIDRSIGKLEKLTYLNMVGCPIAKLPKEIGGLTSLTTFIMEGCGQEFQLPHSVGSLTNLTSLEINGVCITKLPESIGKLLNLKHLLLKNCKSLKKLPDSIGNLKSLAELDISRSKDIIELPNSIGNLKSLKVLDLRGCEQLRRTPDFSSFFLLERLILQCGRRLVEIDPSIVKLEKLTHLNMVGCPIAKLPEKIGGLTSLTTFIVEGWGQEFQLSHSVGNLANLTSLEIRDVCITELPESIGELTNLNHLLLKSCKSLKKLPDSIGNLKSLVELDISRSKDLIELPNSIGNLKSLKVINMNRSGIRRLPATIGLLKCLEEIHAFRCFKWKSEIPEEIGGLSTLKILDLWRCNICGIPKSFYRLTQLKELRLSLSKEYEITDLRWIYEWSSLEVFTVSSSFATTLTLPSTLGTLGICDWTFKSGTRSNDKHSLAAAIPCLEELQMLSNLYIMSCNFCDLDGLHHLRNLRTLIIMNYHKRFPDLSNLRNLIFLYLDKCDGLTEIQGLGKLQSLQTLFICNCNSLDALNCSSDLINLRWLHISECEKLRAVEGLDKLTSLIVLGIEDCRSLKKLPYISLLDCQLVVLFISCPMLPRLERATNNPIILKKIMSSVYDYFPWVSSWEDESTEEL